MELCGLTDCERELLACFPGNTAHLDSYVTSDALHGSMAAGHGLALVVQARRAACAWRNTQTASGQ